MSCKIRKLLLYETNISFLCSMTEAQKPTKKTMDELGRLTPEEAKNAERFPIWIVLDDVRSMHNVGSVFRTADAFHAAGILLCGFTPQPPHRDIHKTALGATETVPWQYTQKITEGLKNLHEQGYTLYAVEQVHDSMSLQQAAGILGKEKIALVFGNEVMGVSEAALELCQGSIEIPQWGSKHSLNISVSAGIVLWEIMRQYAIEKT
jgi:23S rRNA (guanosine2251-2'-O)-methyltransferase